MSKGEFLKGLKEALEGEVSGAEINEQLLYYERYIEEEMKKGKAEVDIVGALGDPRLIARTIIETRGGTSSYGESYYEENKAEEEESNIDGKLHNFQVKGILIIVAIVLVIVGVLSIIFSVVSALAPILVPVILALILVSILKKRDS